MTGGNVNSAVHRVNCKCIICSHAAGWVEKNAILIVLCEPCHNQIHCHRKRVRRHFL